MNYGLILGLVFILNACSHGEPQSETHTSESRGIPSSRQAQESAPASNAGGVSIETKLAGAQLNTPYVTEVFFRRTSLVLSPFYRQKIRKLMSRLPDKTSSDRAIALIWGTPEELAQQRGETVRKYLSDEGWTGGLTIENMEKDPGVLKKFLKSEAFRVRKALEENPNIVHSPGKVVMILLPKKSD